MNCHVIQIFNTPLQPGTYQIEALFDDNPVLHFTFCILILTFATMKILIIRFSSIGDIVLTTPVIRCLKKQLAGVEIHYLTKAAYRDIIEHNPYLSKKFYLAEDLNAVISELKREHYDFVLDLHGNVRSWLVRLKLMKRSDVFNKLNIEKWLVVNFKWNILPDIHIVDRYLEPVRKFGVRNDGQGLDYFISAPDDVQINNLPLTHLHGFAALVIGARHKTKKLPNDKLLNLCSLLPLPVILLGGSEDAADGELISRSDPIKIYNGCGKYTLNQSASIISKSTYVITHDTGLMHIAAALKKKMLSVWGNTIPAFGMFPYHASNQPDPGIMEIKGLSCRPCSKIGYDKCPKGHFRCMNQIDEAEMITRLSGL